MPPQPDFQTYHSPNHHPDLSSSLAPVINPQNFHNIPESSHNDSSSNATPKVSRPSRIKKQEVSGRAEVDIEEKKKKRVG
jgi:hypothetical protein